MSPRPARSQRGKALELERARVVKRMADLGSRNAQKPHGTRARYSSGCRCDLCRKANSDYKSNRDYELLTGPKNPLISPDTARRHIAVLKKAGLGRRTIADASGVSDKLIGRISSGRKLSIRRSTQTAILSVDTSALPDSAMLGGERVWGILDELLADGYTKKQLTEWLGYKSNTFQINRHQVRAKTVLRVEKLKNLIEKGHFKRP